MSAERSRKLNGKKSYKVTKTAVQAKIEKFLCCADVTV